MNEFELYCFYALTKKRKFFKDKKPQEYHKFQVINHEIIPDEYLYKKEADCWLWISSNLTKRANINFEIGQSYRFIMNLGEQGAAKFIVKDIDGRNAMVLKTKDYFKNTVKKIGFWDNKNYFYDSNQKPEEPTKKPNNNPIKAENKTDWGKIILFCLPIIILAFLSFLIIKWASKKKK